MCYYLLLLLYFMSICSCIYLRSTLLQRRVVRLAPLLLVCTCCRVVAATEWKIHNFPPVVVYSLGALKQSLLRTVKRCMRACVCACVYFWKIWNHRAVWVFHFPWTQHQVLSPWLPCRGRSMAFIYPSFSLILQMGFKEDEQRSSEGEGGERREGAAACLLHDRAESCADNMLRVWENGPK